MIQTHLEQMTLADMWKHYPKKRFALGTGRIGIKKMCEKFGQEHVDKKLLFQRLFGRLASC